MPKVLKLFFLLLLAAIPASAQTTYYIDYAAGSNSNNGTAKATPWKTHPYMQTAAGCTGSGSPPTYTHVAGDTFIFKQGSSWPNACFDMVIQAGGASGNPDVYTFDPTWGTPGGTTGNTGQNVGVYEFTAGGNAINGSDGWNSFFLINNVNWIVFNGFAWNGFKITGVGSFGNDQGAQLQQSTNVVFSNCYIHGWNHVGNSSNDSLLWFVGHDGGSSPNNVGVRLTGCVADGANSGGSGIADSGALTYKVPLSDNNLIRNMPNGLLTGANASIHDNIIGPMSGDFDSGNHLNCIEPITSISGATSTNYIYNNVWFGCDEASLLAQGEGPSTGSEIDYIWNNVAALGTVTHVPAAIMDFSSVISGNNSQMFAWNNTVYAGSSTCFRTLSQGGPKFAVVTIQNNHCITDNAFFDNSYPALAGVVVNNPTQTTAQATAQGYTFSQTFKYSPTANTNITVGAGTNLTLTATGPISSLASDTTYGNERTPNARPATGAWNAGAYQFTGSSILQVGPGQTYTTIQACLNAATANQTCNVHAGTYNETATFTTASVTLQANPGDQPIVTGQIISTQNNCTITGMTVTGFNVTLQGGIDVRNTTGCQVTNNTVHDGTGSGIYFRNSTNYLIQGNIVHDISGACCISDGDGIINYSADSTDNTYAHGGKTLNNQVYQNHQDGIEINGHWETIAGNFVHDNIYSNYVSTHPDGIECNNSADGFTDCAHSLIYNNVVKNHNQNIYIDGLGTSAANTDIWIFNNVTFNDPTSSTGVDMTAASASDIIVEQADHVQIFNNTTGSVQFYGFLTGDGGGGGGTQTNVSVFNNVFTSSAQNGFRANPSSAIVAMNNDDYFGNATAISWNSTGYSTAAAFHTATGFEANGLSSNPLLNAFPTPSPQNGSPLALAGANLTSFSGAPAALLADITGAARPASGAWTIGAYNSNSPPVPIVQLSPLSLTFGNQTTGTTSSAQNVTLTNTGSGTLTVTSPISTTGNFAMSATSCLGMLGAGQSCSISVTFTPMATGTRNGTLSVTDNAAGSPQTVSLTGTGVAPTSPAVSLTASSLAFGNQITGTTSGQQSVTLTNTGNANLSISSVALGGTDTTQFAIASTTCAGTVTPTSTCIINVTFGPSTNGSKSAAVVITDNAANSPQNVTLSGTGIAAPAPTVQLTPSSLDFGSETVGNTTSPQTITLKNIGTASLTISSIALTGAESGDYGQSTSCGGTLAVNATCTIQPHFTPTAVGTRTAAVTVTDNAAGSPHNVNLTGTGTAPPVSGPSSPNKRTGVLY